METATARFHRADTAVLAHGYWELTKPGISLFIGLSAAAGYVATGAGALHAATLGWVLVATMMMSGGASALNHVAERRFDAHMRRTGRRPLPAGIISPAAAATFGWTLSALGTLVALLTLPVLAVAFLAASHFTYLYVYTPLKRRTPLCTLAGAVPGALPVLAGSAAAGGLPDLAGLTLAGLLFTWQLPHFLAIGWLMRDDYARAGFPMLGVVETSGRASAHVSMMYALGTAVLAVLLAIAAGLGPLACTLVSATGAAYVAAAVPFVRTRHNDEARRLFFASLLVLPVILAILMLDIALRT